MLFGRLSNHHPCFKFGTFWHLWLYVINFSTSICLSSISYQKHAYKNLLESDMCPKVSLKLIKKLEREQIWECVYNFMMMIRKTNFAF